MQGGAENGAQLASVGVALARIAALVHIPDEGQTLAAVLVNMLAQRVDDLVAGALSGLDAVHDLVPTALGRETVGCVRDARGVVRVGRAVHIAPHDLVGFLAARKIKEIAEARGEHARHDALVNELVYRQGRAQVLQTVKFIFFELIEFHACHPLRCSSGDAQNPTLYYSRFFAHLQVFFEPG